MRTPRHLIVLAVVLAVMASCIWIGPQAHAESGWTYYRGTWIRYTVRHDHSPQLVGRALVVTLAHERAVAIRRARRHRDGHLRDLEALLARARDVLAQARAAISGGVWGCVARWEEGGRNDPAHGFFGFMFAPPGGGSWLGVSWSEQVAIAEGIRSRYGWSAWGPHTRAMCGLG